jgi:hypothetical protein
VTKIAPPQTPEQPQAREEKPAKGSTSGKAGSKAPASPMPPATAKGATPLAPASGSKEDRSWGAHKAGEIAPPKTGFEPVKSAAQQGDRGGPAPSRMVPMAGDSPGALSAMHQAREPGAYFEEHAHQEGEGRPGGEDPELDAAVEEAIRLLFGVRGIHRISPGLNEAKEPVVLIVANRGFSEKSMQAVPPRVRNFPTLVALPYELLPLRRE